MDEIEFHGKYEGLVGVQGPDGGWFIYRAEEASRAQFGTGSWSFAPEGGGLGPPAMPVPSDWSEADVVAGELAGEIMAAEIEEWLDGR